jgi:phospholipase A1
MSTLPGNPTALKTKVEGLITSANSIQSAIDDLNKFVTTSKSKAVAATQKEVQNAEKSLEAAHGRYKNTGLALREYQAVLADCHKRADAASAREESANRQRNDAQRTVTATKKRLQQLQSSHAPSVNVQNAQNAVQQAMSNERRATKAATDASTEIAQIAQEVDEAAGRAISKIDTAMAATKDNWLDKISQFINKVGQVLADITKWVTKVLKKVIAEIVKVIAEVVKALAIVLCIVAVLSVAVLLGIALAALITAMLPALLTILAVAAILWVATKIVAASRERERLDQYNKKLDAEERKNGPANIRYGDNGETTDTINTRPGREGLIRDKMDLAGRPHPRGDWKEPPGWHEVGPAELRKLGIDPALLDDTNTGFHATLFRDDNGRYVLSYTGTDFGDLKGDVINDIEGAAGISPQVRQAIAAATTVKERLMSQGITDGNFSLTGHSLGGELAAAGSIATGAKATTFDAAGLSYSSIQKAMNIARQNGHYTSEIDARARVENYHFTTDILTNAQTILPLPRAYGKQIEVQGKPIDWLRYPFSDMGHGLDIMKERYDEKYGHLYGAQKVQNQDQEVPLYLGGPPLLNPHLFPAT